MASIHHYIIILNLMMINLIVHSFIFKQVKRSEFISILIHPYLTNILSKLLI